LTSTTAVALTEAAVDVSDPTILLCDEPTGDLDCKSADDMVRVLERLVEEQHKTVPMVTHDPLVADRARAVLHMDKGVLAEGLKGSPIVAAAGAVSASGS
jgi:ABC-type lipoprotein export system ATPase subunit